MADAQLRVVGLHKAYGAVRACDGVDLEVLPGEVHAVIGPNGAGKTTLLNLLAGELRPDAGAVWFQGRDVTRLPVHRRARLGLARSYQITSVFPHFTALGNAALAVQAHAGHSFQFWKRARDERRLREPAWRALERVGLADRSEAVASELGHGEQRQLEIAMALATGPRLLLLDEPTAGMGREDTARMVEVLRGLKGEVTMLLVEHDMDAVFALADRITVLVYGRAALTGDPATVRADAEVRRAYLGDEREA